VVFIWGGGTDYIYTCIAWLSIQYVRACLGIAMVACGILLASSSRHELIIRIMISTSFVLIMLSVFTPYSDVLRIIALLIVLVALITGYVLRRRLKN
jgi:hypothetical protein